MYGEVLENKSKKQKRSEFRTKTITGTLILQVYEDNTSENHKWQMANSEKCIYDFHSHTYSSKASYELSLGIDIVFYVSFWFGVWGLKYSNGHMTLVSLICVFTLGSWSVTIQRCSRTEIGITWTWYCRH